MISADPDTAFALTFPDTEAAYVTRAYEEARSIVEYGSGGSTLLAARLGTPVHAIESDSRWAARLSDALPTFAPARVEWVDMGRTKAWGFPANSSKYANYWRYPMAPWVADPPVAPDLVLIDGRMRKACFLATLAMTRQPLTLLFDDYSTRRSYFEIADLLKPTEKVGRLAVFHVAPGLISIDDFPTFLPWFFDVR